MYVSHARLGRPFPSRQPAWPLSALSLSLVAAFTVLVARDAAADTTITGPTADYVFSDTDNLTINAAGSATSTANAGVGLRINSSMGTLLNQGIVSSTDPTGGSALLNDGTIQHAINSGTIAGGEFGVSNIAGKVLERLDNSGTLMGTIAVINRQNAASRIGTLNNSGTISGTYGLVNEAAVGTLINTGRIDVTTIAVQNQLQGNISLFENSGTITAARGLVNLSGTSVGTLRNTGLMEHTGVAVSNIASIGQLINTGTLSSSANSAISNNGTIAGINNSGQISAAYFGISNGVTLTSLINSGTISGGAGAGFGAVYNQGTLGTLNNSGLISGATGVFTDKSIGNLSNSGTLTGSTYALDVAATGSIGVLINSGTIAGPIRYLPAAALTIHGGSGSTFGTITGNAGALGSLLASNAPVVFAGGNLRLNSHISSGGGVSNTGSKLQISNPVTITGNYSQSAGASLIGGVSDGAVATGALSDSGYGRLHVTGNTSLASGSGVSVAKLATYGFAAGQRFVLVSTDGTATYNEGALVYSAEGYAGSVTGEALTEGGKSNLVLTLHAAPTPTPTPTPAPGGLASTDTARAVLDGLGRYDGANIGLLDVFNPARALGSTAEANRAGAQLSPAALQNAAMRGSQAPAGHSAKLVGQRLESLRSGGAAVAAAAGSGVSTGEGFAAGSPAVWGQYFGGRADEDSRNNISGYRASYHGLVLGGDAQLGDSWRAGGLFSLTRTAIKLQDDNAGSTAQSSDYGLTAYAAYDGKPWYLNLIAGVQRGSTESERLVSFTGFSGKAMGTFSGTRYNASVQAGLPLKLAESLTLTPVAGLAYNQLRQDGYTETGSGAALRVDASRTRSLKSDLGLKLERVYATAHGTLTPSVQLGWRHEFKNTRLRSTASFAADASGATAFTALGAAPVRNTAVLALGATLRTGKNLSLSGGYTLEAGGGFKSQSADLRMRWLF